MLLSILLILLNNNPDRVYHCCHSFWGFWAHRQIHRQAAYLMPEPTARFFREHVQVLVDHSVDADDRRRVDPNEGVQHFIDLDRYGSYPFNDLPHDFDQAVKKFGYEKVKENGLVPWRIAAFTDSLAIAFKELNKEKIIYFASNLGHYIADANVPLHATENYDGQLSNQKGIHSRWESTYPQKFMLPIETQYAPSKSVTQINNVTEEAFAWSLESFLLSKKVLIIDSMITSKIPKSELYIEFKSESGRTRIEYSDFYYAQLKVELNQMVEERFRLSVERVAQLWYFAWLKADKPNLDKLLN